ncbi:thiolase family protein [Clostridium sp. Marseille-Q2269]|uniref:thiolase family protein n=1 Tax=Clostridium sp. Marseille-Q2269 TaxID=2942205 RepID=UPI00207354A2|nr:thiolase family protein [Clostridium sp. Marseille-Q2269]
MARLSLLEGGLPVSVIGTTVDFQCGSSLKAINMAASMIKSGERDLIIVGGVESTSLASNKQYNERDPRYEGKDVFYKRAQFSPNFIGDPDMIEGAENTVKHFNIKREEMDKLAVESHFKAIKAKKEGKLKSSICNIKLKDFPLHKNKIEYLTICDDESIRKNISLNLVKRARPILNKHGSITSANACLTHDGGAILLMASEKAIKQYNLSPRAIWRGESSIGLDPNLSPLGATLSIEKLLNKYNLNIDDIDLVEINEAFSLKIALFLKNFNYPREKINIYGGALAYGHPYAASGAIIMLHLLEGLKNEGGKLGIASMGVAGGLGVATLVESC